MRRLAIHAAHGGGVRPAEANFSIKQAGTDESNSEHIRSAMARGLPRLLPAVCANDGHFVIVGSGFSVTQHLDEIRQEAIAGRPICAIKGAHDWLLENDVTPHLFLSVEPRERPLARISDDTIYLLASRCNPALFDQLKDRKVMLWHSWSLEKENETWMLPGEIGIGGGSTSGLRAIHVGYMMGFRKFILYGLDSCLAPDRDTKRFTGEKVGDAKVLDVIVDGRRFWCNGALADQAESFQEIYKTLGDITIDAKGDGLIAAILAARRKRGLPA